MRSHLEAEGIEEQPEENYWLSLDYAAEWQEFIGQTEKGKIGSKEIYRKELRYEKDELIYQLAIAFFENFEPEYADIPEAKIEEEEQKAYLVTEGVTGNGSSLSREDAYGYASEMTLLGETDWDPEVNFEIQETPVLIDFEYFANYGIQNAEDYKRNILETWFQKHGFEFDEERFEQEMTARARNLPDADEVTEILREETSSADQEKEVIESQLKKLEESLKKAKKEDLTLERISDELAPNSHPVKFEGVEIS